MDFIILKVNGKDVSNSSHEDAVRCFQLAEEPIIVEVLRRHPSQVVPAKDEDKSTQDKEEKTKIMTASATSASDDSTLHDVTNETTISLVSTAVQTDWAGLIEDEDLLPETAEEQINGSFEDFLAHDIDFEEVTLRKSGSAEKLGLTVCYSSASGSEEADTEVYISEIVPESLAARDGRLREGDQILQVNGRDVANKEQTENLFAETNNAVTILVSRCLYQDDDYEVRQTCHEGSQPVSPENVPAYQNSMIEQLIRHQQQQQEQQEQSEETSGKGTAGNTATSKVPPVPSHTETNISSTSSTGLLQNSQKSNKNTSPSHNADERKGRLKETTDFPKKVETLNVRPQQPGPPQVKLIESYSSYVWSDTEHIYETIPESDVEPLYSFPYEHQNWQQSKVQNQSQGNQLKPCHSSSKSNSSGEEKDSSSAYNTGESCHSNPLTLELHQGEKDHHKSTLVLCASKHSQQQQKNNCVCPKKSNIQLAKKSSSLHNQRDRDNSSTSTLLADTMYTNVANLQQTMILQQQLFKQALSRRSVSTKETSTRKSKSQGNFQAPSLAQYQFIGSQQVCTANAWTPPEDKCDIQMEWKVKRRADGTRYIARRPIRNRILKNRAIEISEERAGHTTEDDTMSEMKVFKHWPVLE
ncbi:E3 ubiquitin-protein ligase PDZRN3 isoform X2 [Belonocnema kinseyi]|uniref:E3 ubiquitin-protein ligase PDZRN3 isoform X2 n=1 Tax=Belonocnema kinseyi TaxID=2817044 RepID=UPI00143DD4F8|nr:E3 ubiquitin-protein ligase PDZRN3 isoform X2 [Belonocnema kinseyi]